MSQEDSPASKRPKLSSDDDEEFGATATGKEDFKLKNYVIKTNQSEYLSWYLRPNPEDRINRKPEDRKSKKP